MSALFALLSILVRCRRKFAEVSRTECAGQGNDFKLITTVEIETRNPIERYFVVNFRRSVIIADLWRPQFTMR